ncbi:MAG: 30S ribosomal protein S6 [Candidatus Roizmanbacteria bacterium]|nr:MAG: 30S ribosomal protein S6 [Candidatus Roizmanbacteria bacterium]
MTKYEITFLLEKEEQTQSINEIITSLKGTFIDEKKWGQRQLAYPIKKNNSAFYFTWVFEMDRKSLLELKKKLNFNENLIRYLLLVI